MISITDGQIFLETDLFYQGIRPALNVGISVSRVGSAAQIKAMKQVAGSIKLDLAQYREMRAFAQFASDLDEATRKQLDRGQRATEMMKQPQYSPMSVADQALMLFVIDRGHLDDVAIDKVVDFEAAMLSYARSEHADMLDKINNDPVLNDEVEQGLTKIAESFKANHAW